MGGKKKEAFGSISVVDAPGPILVTALFLPATSTNWQSLRFLGWKMPSMSQHFWKYLLESHSKLTREISSSSI